MTPSIRLGRLFGIEIGLNWSLLFIFVLVAWTLAAGVLPADAPGHSGVAYWTAGMLGAVGFYLCLLAHEMSHALVARRAGMKVGGITLWLFGGVSRLEGEPMSAGTEAVVIAVGPLTSLALALAAFGAETAASALGASPLVVDLLGYLAFINLLLGLFNLVPAFPLDGGRLLSSLFWWRTGSRRRSIHLAVRVGRVFAYLMIALGVFELFAGAVIDGVWIAFIGWFLLSAASAEDVATTARAVLHGLPVSAAMTAPVVTVPGWTTVELFLEGPASGYRFTTYPLHDASGRVTGLARLADLLRVPPAERTTRRLSDVARPLADVPTAGPNEDLDAVLRRLGGAPEQRVLVFEQGDLVGILSPVDVARVMTIRQAVDVPARGPSGRPRRRALG